MRVEIEPWQPRGRVEVVEQNPVTHVGKLYSVLARRVATALVGEGAGEAEVVLVSRIGQPVADPWIARAATREVLPAARVEAVLRAELACVPEVTDAIVARTVPLW